MKWEKLDYDALVELHNMAVSELERTLKEKGIDMSYKYKQALCLVLLVNQLELYGNNNYFQEKELNVETKG